MSLRIVKEIELMSSEATKTLVKCFQQNVEVCLSSTPQECATCISLLPGIQSVKPGQSTHNRSLSHFLLANIGVSCDSYVAKKDANLFGKEEVQPEPKPEEENISEKV